MLVSILINLMVHFMADHTIGVKSVSEAFELSFFSQCQWDKKVLKILIHFVVTFRIFSILSFQIQCRG